MVKGQKKTKYLQSSYTEQLPNKAEILSFITDNPNLLNKREIAKAFNLKGDSRRWLKDMLDQLKDPSSISKKHKKITTQERLPPVTLVKISASDNNGGFIAHPLEWKGDLTPNIEIPPRYIKGVSISLGDYFLVKIFRNKTPQSFSYTGRIIRKINKQERTMLGIVKKLENNQWQLCSIDRKTNDLIIETPLDVDIKSGDLVEAEIRKNTAYRSKSAKVKNVLGSIDSEKALSMIALISKGIPYVFPEEVLKQAKDAKPIVSTTNREDWRQLPFITIDPPDAKDHDDAVYAVKDEDPANNDGWIVTVAIADVSYYVKTGSALDQEALKRGNSVYFPDCVVPMLPEYISNNLCSLLEGKDRPALAVRMIFDANGNKRKHSFHRIIMRTVAKLSYQEVQCAIEGNTNEKTAPLLENILQPLWSAYTKLKIARNRRKPLELEVPEKRLFLIKMGALKMSWFHLI